MRLPLHIVSGSAQEQEYHQQLVDQIVDLVAMGALRPGDRLDTLATVEANLGIAHATVARAYTALEARGVIETARRKGSFIAQVSPQLFATLRREFAARQFRSVVIRLRLAHVAPRDMIAALKSLVEDEKKPKR